MVYFKSRNKKPLSVSQIKAEIQKLELKLEIEAMKYDSEKKVRDKLKEFKKKLKKLSGEKRNFGKSFNPKNMDSNLRFNSNNSRVNDSYGSRGVEEVVVADFAKKLKSERQRRKMTQKEFAALILEKESLLQKWESGVIAPSIEDAKQLGRRLKIFLIEKIGAVKDFIQEEPAVVERKEPSNSDLNESNDFLKKLSSSNLGRKAATLGDLVKIKYRKK